MCGMVEQAAAGGATDKPLLAATMFGVTTPCVTRVRERLEAAGYEVLVFHATGTGGQAMEALIRDGFIAGVLDVTTTEWCDELVGGDARRGPDRLEAAGTAGMPQVVSVGALDMVNFGPATRCPTASRTARFYRHNANVTLMRTTPEENAELGRIIAEKLNAATGPTVLLLPLRGVSAIDTAGPALPRPGGRRGALRRAPRAPSDALGRPARAGPTHQRPRLRRRDRGPAAGVEIDASNDSSPNPKLQNH